MKHILIATVLLSMFLFSCQTKTANNTDNQEQTTTDTSAVVEENYDEEYRINTNLTKGDTVPDFSLTTVDGKVITMSELRGKTVFLNFFSLTCPMCMKELPVLQEQLWDKHKDRNDLVILAIGREHTADEMLAFREKKSYRFPIAPDPDRSVYSLFAKKYIPRNIIINKDGIVVLAKVGYKDGAFPGLLTVLEEELGL